MNADSKLSLKCPSCGQTQQKALSVIKTQSTFECMCGYHVHLQPKAMLKPRGNIKATPQPSPTEKDDTLAITA